jgi:hypothetical protein
MGRSSDFLSRISRPIWEINPIVRRFFEISAPFFNFRWKRERGGKIPAIKKPTTRLAFFPETRFSQRAFTLQDPVSPSKKFPFFPAPQASRAPRKLIRKFPLLPGPRLPKEDSLFGIPFFPFKNLFFYPEKIGFAGSGRLFHLFFDAALGTWIQKKMIFLRHLLTW